MITSKGRPSTLEVPEDQLLAFDCCKFRRGVRATQPRSHRWVSAEQSLCTSTITENSSRLYDLYFTESSDEEEAKELKQIDKRYPGIALDCIGVFNPDGQTIICVPPDFMDVLWTAAIAADGVLRTLRLSVRAEKGGGWAIFEASLSERITEPHFWMEKFRQPAELQALRAQLRSLGLWGVAIIAAGVLVASWIAKLWH